MPSLSHTEGWSATSYDRDLATIVPLTPEQAMRLVAQLPSPVAQQQLIEGFLHTVVVMAQHYYDQEKEEHDELTELSADSAGMTLMELIAEGNLCLVQTIHRFHSTQGGSLYGTIEAALHTCMQQAITAASSPQTLDMATTSLTAPDSEEPLTVLLRQDAWDELKETLLQLSPRQRQVLARWCGFGGDAQSLAAIGHALGISCSEVRQYQRRGLRTLRQASAALRLLV